MKNYILNFTYCLILAVLCTSSFYAQEKLRAPAYPLITHNPNFSIWSMGDELNGSPTKHWTGQDHSLIGIVNVDGKYYRFMGEQGKTYETVLPASDELDYKASYTEKKPAADWNSAKFDDSTWKTGEAPFSDDRSQAKTIWKSSDLWYRRSFDMSEKNLKTLYLKLRHDDNVTAYINGVQVYDTRGWQHTFKYIPLKADVISSLKRKNNILAIHIKNTAGGQWLDAGLVTDAPSDEKINIQKAEQTGVDLTAMQTTYTFKCGPLDLTATFTSPLLLDDMEIFSRPISYLSVKTKATDGKNHSAKLYLGASGNIAVNMPSQEVEATTFNLEGLAVSKVGTTAQPVLETKGDDVRIDWGYFYIATPAENTTQSITTASTAMSIMTDPTDTLQQELTGRNLIINTVTDLGTVNNEKSTVYMLGYDEVEAINYFGTSLKPWFKKDGTTMKEALVSAHEDYDEIIKKCTDFDEQLYRDTKQAGGEKYAQMCELAYRQCIAAHTLVEAPNGDLLWLSKENNSNGSINTVDLTYPSAPLFLVYNPDLEKGQMNGIFYYSESGKWKKPFAAHDLGTYPIATGQTYGEDMPVEEAGNMVILALAIAQREGNADYAKDHWETLTTWANYLMQNGFDPANQLSTDDFAGHLARNANLSIKAIMAIASYGKLAGMIGDPAKEKEYTDKAKEMAKKWTEIDADGDHYDLAFEKKGTWSQKYNMVWDDILDLNIFPKEVHQKEIAFYLTKQNKYGLPLDSRETYTKSDWVYWTATMADKMEDFRAIADPMWLFADETPDRVPLSDWHWTEDAKQRGFKARSVVGGYFIKLLKEQGISK